MLPTITCLADVAQVVHRAKKQRCSSEFEWRQESGGAFSEKRTDETCRSGDSSKRFLGAIWPSMTHCRMPRCVKDSIIFLHEVARGAADRSYGIHVAKLAGLPASVIARAEEVLRALEEGREGHKPLARIDDLPLFSAARDQTSPPKQTRALEEKLAAILPDSLTPKAALELLYELKALLDRS